jgi:hypothetical protein
VRFLLTSRGPGAHVHLTGAATGGLGLIAFVFGLGQTAVWGWSSPGVIGSLVVGVVAFALFIHRERRAKNPLMSFALLRERRNYLGATISQALAGMAEMGLGLIFPLLLILNLQMNPALAGLALIPTTLPMVIVAPLAGRWYDRAGGRPPLVVGFGSSRSPGSCRRSARRPGATPGCCRVCLRMASVSRSCSR